MDQVQNPVLIPDTIRKSFERSLVIRSCSYKPEIKVVEGYTPGTFRTTIPLEERLGHFLVYCEEKGKEGSIVVTRHEKEEFFLTSGAKGWFYPVQADVILDGKVVASDIAAQACLLDNLADLDSVVQVASGIAKSRALAAAGFGGLVSGADFYFNGGCLNPVPASTTQDMAHGKQGNQQFPAPMGVVHTGSGCTASVSQPRGNQMSSTPVTNVQTNCQESPAVSAALETPPAPQQTSFISPAPQQYEGPIDPRKTDLKPETLNAKLSRQIVCTMNGPSVYGKTMEQILNQDPSKIEYMAKRWKKTGSDADLIRRAAELLLPDAMRKMGK